MEYKGVVEELKSRGSDRKEPSLEATKKALELLGQPDKDYEVVLIGGTNGKGSVVEMVSEMLSEEYDVGSYKSPHLVTCRERVKVNGDLIPKEDFVRLYHKIESLGLELTFFEFMTVMAFQYFSDKNVDYAIMEVGMGGRLDATNAAENEYAVITNIGKDHQQYLGETKDEIAMEKAGIIPESGVLVTSSQNQVLTTIAEERNTRIEGQLQVDRENEDYVFELQNFSLPVKGRFQRHNLETALSLVRQVDEIPSDLEKAFSGLDCPGRMEIVNTDPLYIHEGAHNPEALREVVKEFPEDSNCVFNALGSKNISEMVALLEERVSKFYLTDSGFRLSESPKRIARHISVDYEIVEDPDEAVSRALEDGKPVVVTGSLYLIGAVKKARNE